MPFTPKLNSIESVLMKRDGLSEEEALQMIKDFKNDIKGELDANNPLSLDFVEELFMSVFGLEPDYLMELLVELEGFYD